MGQDERLDRSSKLHFSQKVTKSYESTESQDPIISKAKSILSVIQNNLKNPNSDTVYLEQTLVKAKKSREELQSMLDKSEKRQMGLLESQQSRLEEIDKLEKVCYKIQISKKGKDNGCK